MKPRLIAMGIASVLPMMAGAQGSTNVTLYGIVGTGIEYVNNVYNVETGEKHSSVHFNNVTSSISSRWGLRGKEDLGNGLSAAFVLESGFNTATGISRQGGRLFGRQAWVGLKGDFGQLAFGRQYNMLKRGLAEADLLGSNTHGLASLNSYIPNTRMDNSITYLGKFDGLRFGAAYARGRETLKGCGVDYTDQTACQAWSVMLGYDAANWGVAAAYDVLQGTDAGGGAWNEWYGAGAPLLKDEKDRHWTLNGYVKFDDLKISLIYLNRKNDAGMASYAGSLGDRSDMWSLNAAYQASPSVIVDGSVNYLRYKDADVASKSWFYVARARYLFSKRTHVFISAAYMDNKGYAANSASSGTSGAGFQAEAGESQTSVAVGLTHHF
ncbi:porin [Pusillimonas noertemannii]|uniref:porin n=1 Tax=Pusillimonas noertemannii TaxID=305977 RepID=UPI001FAEE7B5|nr:porin [Pusillimonas noertemannii]